MATYRDVLPTLLEPGRQGLMDLKDQRFGKLVVLQRVRTPKGVRQRWLCRCDCGQTVTVGHERLIHTRSPKTHCGCALKGLPTLYSQEYHIWDSMHRRCETPTHVGFEHYGAKGIKVCEKWSGEEGFKNFLADIGPRPSPGHSIDRSDPGKGYTNETLPDGRKQVRWATSKEQGRNKRSTVRIPDPRPGKNGELIAVAQLAEEQGLTYHKCRYQLQKQGLWPYTDQ